MVQIWRSILDDSELSEIVFQDIILVNSLFFQDLLINLVIRLNGSNLAIHIKKIQSKGY